MTLQAKLKLGKLHEARQMYVKLNEQKIPYFQFENWRLVTQNNTHYLYHVDDPYLVRVGHSIAAILYMNNETQEAIEYCEGALVNSHNLE